MMSCSQIETIARYTLDLRVVWVYHTSARRRKVRLIGCPEKLMVFSTAQRPHDTSMCPQSKIRLVGRCLSICLSYETVIGVYGGGGFADGEQ
jgi:hypothetical protein